jgi:uncharacterized protein YbjT (DUF2867 family)
MNNINQALVLGASGLVGQSLVRQLLADERYAKVTCLLRRPLANSSALAGHVKLEPIVIDYARLQEYQGYFAKRHVYVCLGTTLKQAKSKQAFRKVDFEYVHVAAQLARDQQARSFVWISSVGANAKSANFYLRVKGELEDAILAMPHLCHPSAVRPSLLMGQRKEKRSGEYLGILLGQWLAPLLCGSLAKYRPIHADDVAAQMISLQVF